jgi:hypothetical protein
MIEIEHYGESLESHPGFLFMKKMWLEDQIDLEKNEDLLIFVDPPKINSKELFKGINLTLTKNKDEENILRDPMGNSQTG